MSCCCSCPPADTCLPDQVAALITNQQDHEERLAALEGSAARLFFEPATFGVIGDLGRANQTQLDTVAAFDRFPLEGILMAGDNNYTSDLDSDYLAMMDWVLSGRLFPCLGNHDLDNTDREEEQISFYPSLFQEGEKRYYDVFFPKGSLHVFVLSDGLQSDGDNIENSDGDGAVIGSVQYKWFIDKVKASNARWKVVMFHHPMFTIYSGATMATYLDWGFEHLGIDLVINGHDHANWHLRRGNIDYINCSLCGQTARVVDPDCLTDPSQMVGNKTGAWAPWIDLAGTSGNRGLPAYCLLNTSPNVMDVRFYRLSNHALIHQFQR